MLPKPFPITSERHLALYDRLIAKVQCELVVDWRGAAEALGPCWLFTGEWSDGKGFKKVRFDSHILYVHRAMYEVLVGPVPPALVLDHLCRRRACCNPDHLEPVTMRVNTERGNGRWIYWQGVDYEPADTAGDYSRRLGGARCVLHCGDLERLEAMGPQSLAA